MIRRRKPHIPLRRQIYIGCEGASEVYYAGFLQELLRDEEVPVHLQIKELGPGTGDPLSRIEMAVLHLNHFRAKRAVPEASFVLLDSDQAEQDRHRAELACRLAGKNNIRIVWQRPCFEAVLLRHLPGKKSNRPPDTAGALRALSKEWTDYKKPMTRANLAKRIDKAAVLRVVEEEPELSILLKCIGLVRLGS